MKTLRDILLEYKVSDEAVKLSEYKTVEDFIEYDAHGEHIMEIAKKLGIDKKLLMLTAANCARKVKHLIHDTRLLDYILKVLKYADGAIDDEELNIYAERAMTAATILFKRTDITQKDVPTVHAATSVYYMIEYVIDLIHTIPYHAALALAYEESYDARSDINYVEILRESEKEHKKVLAYVCRKHLGGIIIYRINEMLTEFSEDLVDK
jgi:hypothetical protein